MDRLQKTRESKRKNKGGYRRWYSCTDNYVFFNGVRYRKTFLLTENVICEGD